MGRYKGYDPEVGKKAKLKYCKEKQHRIELSWKTTDYDERIAPAIEKSGLPAATYIKQAVDEKIARDLEESE